MNKMNGLNQNESSLKNAELSVRIVVADHYMSRPLPGLDVVYSEFRGSDVKQVPVLRVFGPTTDGHKACVHIHGVFPYFYIPCGSQRPEPQLLYKIAASLDKALNITLKQANSANQHIYKITLVKGLPFYGFHFKEHLFFKVFLYNPGLLKQAVELFSNGAILGQIFQPHEAHLNFTLQFFIDFNLFGMSNIDLQTVKFRTKPSSGVAVPTGGDICASDDTVKAESMCYYEVDTLASHIINRQRIDKGDGIENPGLEEVWNKEKERRKQLNMSIGSKSLTQKRDNSETDSHYMFEKMFWIKMSNLMKNPVNVVPPPKEQSFYPAESLEGSQFFNASDVSIHQPCDTLGHSLSESLRGYLDETIVDENVALNCSVAEHLSQVVLDSDDMDLVDMLKDMEQPVDEDSILGTQVEIQQELEELDDAEYSQIFNDKQIEELNGNIIEEPEGDTLKWEDSFWESASIPQLDGTCDDEHTKKVHKRKMPRTRSLGLAHPKAKSKTVLMKSQEDILYNSEPTETAHLATMQSTRGIEKYDEVTPSEIKFNLFRDNSQILKNNDHLRLCKESKLNKSVHNVRVQPSILYDKQNNFVPAPGPSNITLRHNSDGDLSCDIINCSLNSESPTDKGIISFYDMSKVFDSSPENMNDSLESKAIENKEIFPNIKDEKVSPEKNFTSESSFLRLHQTNSSNDTLSSEMPQSQVSRKYSLMSGNHIQRKVILMPKLPSPTSKEIASSLNLYDIPEIIHQYPYFSNFKDVGNKVEIGQMLLRISSKAAQHQKPFSNIEGVIGLDEWRKFLFMEHNELCDDLTDSNILKNLLAGKRKCIIKSVKSPPSANDVKKWLQLRNKSDASDYKKAAFDHVEVTNVLDELENSQVIGLNTEEISNSLSLEDNQETNEINESLQISMQPDGSYLCFGSSKSKKECQTQSPEAPTVEYDFLTIMAIEILTAARGDLTPDPQYDAINAVFISIVNDSPHDHFLPRNVIEVIVVDDKSQRLLDRCGLRISITYAQDECALIEQIISNVRKWDPDILCAYEIELASWGYLFERAGVLGLELVPEISRITEKNRQRKWRSEENNYEGRVLGRVIFNVWRMLRHELALSSYSFESTMYHILKERVPSYSSASLAEWWQHESRLLRWIPVEYYLTRLSGTIRILEKLDMIKRTSELARLFGLQWWEVLSRGSQFRVESLMLRAARPLNLIALSPSVKQRAAMKAPECLPLIFEPESRFYSDPVIVLDFQSLYPSMMIAYNYCFSTCIGRVQNISGESAYEFGAWRLRVPREKLERLVREGHVHWSPVGVGFVSPAVRRGVLPALLRRILAARQAVKATMKLQTDDAVKRAMHSRQLGLKLIANVTYGYTAANFSGRMPCVEVGDSVVAKGRETLERAIRLVEVTHRWNAKVVYGDTDSMFVLVPGASRAHAFRIGQEIADAVTADNPAPVALKLEKVYQPCILQTKKRYVGFMYESAEQVAPVYEAKGIETVRRDGCPAAVKLLQQCLCELFTSGDVSRVKELVVATLARLTSGRLPVHELLFTREYHGAGGYRPGAAAPPLEIARRVSARDRRATPRAGERVAWVVCAGAPGLPLVRLARSPRELAADASLRPHVAYYVTRAVLPPLHRCLSLVGADVYSWYSGMARRTEVGVGGIVQYMCRERCVACGARAPAVCRACAAQPQRTVAALACELRASAEHLRDLNAVCTACCGHRLATTCVNMECPVRWRRQSARLRLQRAADTARAAPPQLYPRDLHLDCTDLL